MATEATKITYIEAAAPSTPAASRVTVYAKADGLMYSKDDAGAETLMSGGTSGAMATDALWDAAGDVAIGTGANTAARLAKGAAGTALVAGATTVSWVDILPWHVVIVPMLWTPDATTGTWAYVTQSNASVKYFFHMPESTATSGASVMIGNSGGASPAQNDAWAVDVILAAGTWDAHFYVGQASSTAIITLQQDGVDQGTVDTYSAASAASKKSITGFTVATTGKKRMNIKAATKHASSSGYLLLLNGIEFRRTA